MATRRRSESRLPAAWVDFLLTGAIDSARAERDADYREVADDLYFDGSNRALILEMYERHEAELVHECARRKLTAAPWALRMHSGEAQ